MKMFDIDIFENDDDFITIKQVDHSGREDAVIISPEQAYDVGRAIMEMGLTVKKDNNG